MSTLIVGPSDFATIKGNEEEKRFVKRQCIRYQKEFIPKGIEDVVTCTSPGVDNFINELFTEWGFEVLPVRNKDFSHFEIQIRNRKMCGYANEALLFVYSDETKKRLDKKMKSIYDQVLKIKIPHRVVLLTRDLSTHIRDEKYDSKSGQLNLQLQ